ncbi:PQQ-binding-like beta-propeller repeat protein [Rhodocytophaga aerolata]|uniref:PQQ-binding-like beta-propeller repeat protein n=1 Tax=Rhodocytophaga aerolata TaxID=455078 RepID=A0ABT8RGL2_9BACT|nr:PQQ-binding-like beta-propeller repeat protein [Rhodocytophaga aerolata]MDO1451230.1 PQQ-binding-like beta-propeller repeat protein [Rhodocytophaga aerolata]
MKKIYFLLLCLFIFRALQAQELDTNLWETDGQVNTIVRNGNTIYLGGAFSYVGPNTGSGVVMNLSDGELDQTPSFKIIGNVNTSIPDGKGGWFIGGSFTQVQGEARTGLAHLLPNGMLNQAWNPILTKPYNLTSTVNTLVLSNNTLFIGGDFTSIGEVNRNNLAALDASTGKVIAWNPSPDLYGHVYSLAFFDNTIYVGGDFTSIGGASRNHLAAIDALTGEATAWNPNANSLIHTITISGNTVYVGGYFSSIGGQSRNLLAALDVTTGQATAWNPNLSISNSSYAPRVITIAVSGNIIYVGGFFTAVGRERRDNLAAIDGITGQATAWNPLIGGSKYDWGISSLAVSNNIVYVGGNFTLVGGENRQHLAAIDAATGKPTSWSPIMNKAVYNISISDNTIFVGGEFTSVDGESRNNLAAIDITTGQATAWKPESNGPVKALAFAENTLYVGGTFNSIGKESRNNLAAIDITTGQVTAWNPNPNTSDYNIGIQSLALAGSMIYIAGDFAFIGGESRNKLASIHTATGLATTWNPNLHEYDYITTLVISNKKLYVGGRFGLIANETRNSLASFDITTGQITPWNPNLVNSGTIEALAIANNRVYVGGDLLFTDVTDKYNLAAVDATTGKNISWYPNPTGGLGYVVKLAASNNIVYASGLFTTIGGQERNGLAAFDAISGQVTSWNPNLNLVGSVNEIAIYDSVIYLGGMFQSIQGKGVSNFAALSKDMHVPTYNLLKGTVYEDTNGNCVKDAGEKGIPSMVVVAKPGDFYGFTDSLGNYTLAVDTGRYTIEQVISETKAAFIKQTCPITPNSHLVHFTGSNESIARLNFANQIALLPQLSVNVSSDRRRRCFTNTTTVSYCNNGTADAADAKVYVQLPEYVVLKSANAVYTKDTNNNYIFNIGSLSADACGKIVIQDSVICGNSSIRDLTQCTKAWITPANSSTPSGNWDQSDITLKAKCLENGRVYLGIYNSGKGNMADSSAFRIYFDAQLVFMANYKLAKGDSLILQVPANGQTMRLEVDQRLYHPSRIQSHITIEACGTNKQGTVSKGYVNQQVQEEEELEIATECLPIIDSFDPNDKTVSPQGIGSEHYTPTNKALDYVIRFQNTGTDVAYKVVVVDTLSEHLDIRTLQVGAVSHSYKITVSGKGKPVLTFTFDNIMLPDSNRNELQSHGYIQFRIKPKANLPEKTQIDNFADIFFDYNEPVRTNTTFNTIYDIPVIIPSGNMPAITICLPSAKSFAGNNRFISRQDTIYMQADLPTYGEGKWKLLKGQGIIKDLTNPASLIADIGYGENIFEWKVSSNSCATDSTVSVVTIKRISPPTVITVDSVCGQGSITFRASGSDTNQYRWYHARDTASVVATGSVFTTPVLSATSTYYVSITESGYETEKIASKAVVKPLPPTPIVTQSSSDSLFCSIAGTSYQWFMNGNAIPVTSQRIQVSESGNYTVSVSVDECTSPMSEIFTYEKITTGLEELSLQIRVYPNPASGTVFVELPLGWQAKVSLLDPIGRTLIIHDFTSIDQKKEIVLSGIKAGIYMLYIETQKGMVVKKLTIR